MRYCRLAQAGQEATFHLDHIQPRCDGGPTTLENLALACVSCSLRKESRQTAVDPLTKRFVQLYHPRRHSWNAHFAWDEVILVAKTPIGRATLTALDLNRPVLLAIREEEILLDRHPPTDQ